MSDIPSMSVAAQEPRVANIAVIDDEGQYFDVAISALSVAGSVEVQPFISIAAFEKQKDTVFDVCITDVYFHGKSEITGVCNYLQQNCPDTKLIILSNFTESINKSIKNVVSACLAKVPVVSRESILRDAVIKAIRESSRFQASDKEQIVSALLELDSAPRQQADTLSELRHDSLLYRLRKPGSYSYGGGCFSLNGFEEVAVGTGDSIEEARVHFIRSFHRTFQGLYARRSGTLSDDDSRKWKEITEVVDLDDYERNRHSISPREVGVIVSIEQDNSTTIRWWGGEHADIEEVVFIEDCPAEFASMGINEWFEGTVVRQAFDGAFVRIAYAERINDPNLSEEQRVVFWSKVNPYTCEIEDS